MYRDVMHDLQDKICDICNKLSTENKLITTKSVLSILQELIPDQVDDTTKENVASVINLWRLAKVEQPLDVEKSQQQLSYNHNKQLKELNNKHLLNQKISKYRKQIVKTKRQVRFLKAKIKVLNSFYNRQRQEFIMRIEGMLYK